MNDPVLDPLSGFDTSSDDLPPLDAPIGSDGLRRQQALLTRLLLGAPAAGELQEFWREPPTAGMFEGPRASIAAWLFDYWRERRTLPTFEQCRARFGDVADGALLPETDRGRATSSAESLVAQADALREAYVERMLGDALLAASQQYARPESRRLVRDTLRRGLAEADAGATTAMRLQSFANLTSALRARYESAKAGELWGTPLPFPFLHQACRGMSAAEFGFILAKPGVGKTWALCACACAAAIGDPWLFTDPAAYQQTKLPAETVAQQAATTLIASMEMPVLDIGLRCASMIGRLPYTDLRHGRLSAQHETTLQRLFSLLERPDYFGGRLHFTEAPNVDQLRAMADRVNAGVILIDGVYLMQGRGEKRWEQLQSNLQVLRTYGLSTGRRIIMTSQFDTQTERIAFSQAIEQDATLIVECSATAEMRLRNQLRFRARKTREARIANEYLYNWNPDASLFSEIGPAAPMRRK